MSAGVTGTPARETTRADRLEGLLRASNRRRRLGAMAAVALRGLAILVGVFLACVAIDAAFGLPTRGLVALDAALLFAALVGLGLILAALWAGRYDPRRAAVRLERALGIDDSRLIATVDLMREGSPGGSESLRRYAIERGDAFAGEIARDAPAAAVDRDALVRAIGLAIAMLLLLAIAGVAVPRVVRYVVPRLAQPFADHPPFTLLDFAVTIDPERVIQGRPATIRVAIDGPMLPDRADLVWIGEDGERRRAPLLRLASDAGDIAGGRRFSLHIERAEATRAFYIDTADGRSHRHTLRVVPLPLFEDATVLYDYPAYTGWPPRTEPFVEEIRALIGTRVTLEVTSNVRVDGGDLTLVPGDDAEGAPRSSHALSPDPAETTRGAFSFPLAHSGRFRALLRHGDLTTPEPLTGALHALPDAPPVVQIVDPAPAVAAPEGGTVEVTVRASDDVGVSELAIHRTLNDSSLTPLQLPIAAATPRHDAMQRFDLDTLGAKAGDVITYFATAWDNRPAAEGYGGPQVAQTEVHVIQVISREEFDARARTRDAVEALSAEWAGFRGRLDELAAQREQVLGDLQALELDGEADRSEAEQQRLDALRVGLEAYRDAAADLAADLQRGAEREAPSDLGRAYRDQLARIGRGLQAQASAAEALSRAMRGRSAEVRGDAERFAQQVQPFDPAARAERDRLTEEIQRDQLAGAMPDAAGADRGPAAENGPGAAVAEAGLGDAEQITAAAAAERSGGVTALPGVPMQFRDAAQAYFRRLAEDQRYNADENREDPR